MANDSGTGLPASIEAAWGMRERPAKGPRPGLSLERIVAAAVDIAAAEGIGAVSMGRVAKQLLSSPMSLYRYVTAKEELLQLMVDAATGPPAPFPEPVPDWRSGLTHWATEYRSAMLRNPWILRVPISGPPITPNSVSWMEQGLAALRATPLGPGDKMSVILLVSGFVRNEATLQADIAEIRQRAAGPSADVLEGYSAQLRRLTAEDHFPELRQVIGAGVLDEDDDPDYEFDFGMARLLDGIEDLVRTRSAGQQPDPARPAGRDGKP